MAKATITVYGRAIGGGYVDIISAEEREEKISARAKELYEDEEEFYEWLEDHYSAVEVWGMTEDRKKYVKEVEFKNQCVEWAYDDMNDKWDAFEITTEVDCPCDCHND